LTSQIFANIYLNEFDRYVRHALKPLAYVRYGDDFILFFASKQETLYAREVATDWLKTVLKLQVHPDNTFVVRVRHGIRFLGHWIYPSSDVTVEPYLLEKIPKVMDRTNAASYMNSRLPRRYAKRMPWILKEKL
jgi:hypothetical protein